jgi:hypothetical protein
MNKPPPIPPGNRSPKGTGEPATHAADRSAQHNAQNKPPTKDPHQQGQTANTEQNTTHQGYQQDR